MGTSTILGSTYQTIRAPDGREWIKKNLQWDGAGVDYNNDPANRPIFGRLYTHAEMLALVLHDGWRVATLADWQGLSTSLGGNAVAGGKLKSLGTTYWTTPNTGATDEIGFDLRGAGYYKSDDGFPWYQLRDTGAYWIGASILSLNPSDKSQVYFRYNTAALEFYDISEATRHFSIRLVRDPWPFPAEAHETTHALALEWTEAADGTPVAYDDGASYDYIESTITVRMTPDELTALETAWQSSTKLYTIYSTGYLLGPLIDMSAGVEVRLMSYQVDQSADSAMTLYDVTIGVHYGPLSAPSAGSLAVVQTRGRPYHSVAPGAASWITEGGTSDVNAYGRASERSCTWYTHSLTTAQAADVVNALRTLRGSSTTWTAGGVATPWGPGESGTATVWIPEWSVHRESNLLWGVQMELVRNG